jgi:hypothetical protein
LEPQKLDSQQSLTRALTSLAIFSWAFDILPSLKGGDSYGLKPRLVDDFGGFFP